MSSASSESSSQLLEKFNILKSEMQQLIEKIAEIELERDEHQIVLEAMKPMLPSRKCFRQISGVLIEQTVKDTIPYLEHQLNSILTLLDSLIKQKETKQNEFVQCQQKLNTTAY